MTLTDPPTKAGGREWLGLAVLALPCLLYSMDLTVLHLAVPKLTADLQPSSAELLWIIDIYGFLIARCRGRTCVECSAHLDSALVAT